MEIQTVKLTRDGGYLINGTMSVPIDRDNRHYRMIQEWIVAGNEPTPADPEPAFQPTDLEVRLAALESKSNVTDADRLTARNALTDWTDETR